MYFNLIVIDIGKSSWYYYALVLLVLIFSESIDCHFGDLSQPGYKGTKYILKRESSCGSYSLASTVTFALSHCKLNSF